MFLCVIYWITAIIHVIYPIFGRDVSDLKAIIPFYGWIKLFKKKRYLVLIPFFALFMQSCDVEVRDILYTQPYKFILRDSVNDVDVWVTMHKFPLKEHSMVYFTTPDAKLNIIHDPDCPCLKKDNSMSSIFGW